MFLEGCAPSRLPLHAGKMPALLSLHCKVEEPSRLFAGKMPAFQSGARSPHSKPLNGQQAHVFAEKKHGSEVLPCVYFS
jgi:hypothetical protein